MAEVTVLGERFAEFYREFLAFFPSPFDGYMNLLLLVLIVSVYCVFVWKFYRFVATRDIISLNLNQYNKTENPHLAKILAGGLYFLEYIIILPFIIFFWFGIFTIFLAFLTENLETSQILIISATIIATIRMTSYYKEDLAKDIAKLLPFTLLGIAITKFGFIQVDQIIAHIISIPTLFGDILNYLIFIIILEIILRLFSFLFSILGVDEPVKEPVEEKEN